MALITSTPPPELLRPNRFYQGCGRVIKGTRLDRIAFLSTVESSGRSNVYSESATTPSRLTHLIEPKSDGTWVALVSDGNGDVYILTKTGTHKTPDDMEGIKLLPNTIVVGELAGGSQQATEDIRQHGCRFVKVFDVLKVRERDTTLLTLLKRKSLLKAVFAKLASKGGRWADGLKYLVKMPMWSTELVARYNDEPEGLIAKEIHDGPYVCGSRNKAWIKVKKAFSDPYIITGWTRSTALTKASRSIHGMAESVTVAGWVPDSEVTATDNIRGHIAIHGLQCTLVELMAVGAMTDDMALNVAADFDYWRGKVVKVGHYKLFKSGAGRHPFILGDEDGLAMLEECHHTACIYRLADRKGGQEL